MYGIFIHPAYRHIEEWLWNGLYDFLGHFSAQEVCYIGPRAPILCEGHTWETWWKKNGNKFSNTFGQEMSPNWRQYSINDIRKIPSHFLEISLFNELIQDLKTPDAVFAYIRHEKDSKLTKNLTEALKKFQDYYNLKVMFSFWPCPSLVESCKNVNIPIFFIDISAMRPPHTVPLHFFDSTATHSDSNFLTRYDSFKKTTKNYFSNHTKQQLIDILVNEEFKSLFLNKDSNEYDIGIAMQSSWYIGRISGRKQPISNEELVSLVMENYTGEKILVRNSPSSHSQLSFAGTQSDTSRNSIEFIKKCKKIITVQSNLAFESILCDKETYVLSDNVHKIFSKQFITNTQHNNNELDMLNYFIFGYLIPSELRFDKEYIQWRLNNPPENDIYKLHYEKIVNSRKNNAICTEHAIEKCVTEKQCDEKTNNKIDVVTMQDALTNEFINNKTDAIFIRILRYIYSWLKAIRYFPSTMHICRLNAEHHTNEMTTLLQPLHDKLSVIENTSIKYIEKLTCAENIRIEAAQTQEELYLKQYTIDRKFLTGAQGAAFTQLGLDYRGAHLRVQQIVGGSEELRHLYAEYQCGALSEHWTLFAALNSVDIHRILELGTYNGEFTRFLSMLFPNAEIVTIDLPDDDPVFIGSYGREDDGFREHFLAHRQKMLAMPNITFLKKNSFYLPALKLGTFDCIWVDACHEYPDVAWDVCNAWHCCRPNGLIACDDIYLSNTPAYGNSNAARDAIMTLARYQICDVHFILKCFCPESSANPHVRKHIGIIRK